MRRKTRKPAAAPTGSARRPEEKRNLWALINAPISLFLFSVIAVSLAGTFYTSRQECIREAEEVERAVTPLFMEMEFRRANLLREVRQAQTLDEAKRASRHAGIDAPSLLTAYGGKSLFDLETLFFGDLISKIEPSDVFEGQQPFELERVPVYSVRQFEKLTEEDFPAFKQALSETPIFPQWVAEIRFADIVPNCSMVSVGRRLVGQRVPVAKAEISEIKRRYIHDYLPRGMEETR